LAVGHAVAGQGGEDQLHLIAGLDRLLNFVTLLAIIIVQREQCIRGFLSGIRNNDDLIVVGVGPPLAAGKVVADSIGERRLHIISAARVTTGRDRDGSHVSRSYYFGRSWPSLIHQLFHRWV